MSERTQSEDSQVDAMERNCDSFEGFQARWKALDWVVASGFHDEFCSRSFYVLHFGREERSKSHRLLILRAQSQHVN